MNIISILNILKFIYSKREEGVYRIRTVLGIKIITKPADLRLKIIEENIISKQESLENIISKQESLLNNLILCAQHLEEIRAKTENSNTILSNYNIAKILESPEYQDEKRLEKFSYSVYSQNGEDGIINEIFKRIGTANKFFVEFGVQDGLESNSHYLLFQGWRGVFIEGDSNYYNSILNNFKQPISDKRLTVLNKFITAENINDILSQTEAAVINEIDFLSIDIDGNDYHVLKAINMVNPRVIAVEYNSKFPPPIEYIMPYNPNYVWDGSDNQGVSLESISNFHNGGGYKLVATDINGVNAFFVRADLCEDKFVKDNSAKNLYNPPRWFNKFYKGHPSRYFLQNGASKLLNLEKIRMDNEK